MDLLINKGVKLLAYLESPVVKERTSPTLFTMLALILDVVEDAEIKQLRDEEVKKWLEDVKDLCYEVIDVLEELKLQEAKKVLFLGHRVSIFNPFRRHKMEAIIHKIEDELRASIHTMEGPLGLHHRWKPQEQIRSMSHRQTSSFVMEADIRGRDYDITILTEMLLNPSTDGQKQDVQYISIVGVAGIGKTALAQVVYNRPQVRCHFDLRSWIWVSKQFNLSEIAQSMLEGLTGESVHGKVGLESLFQRIGDIIGGKRFLFVLDDVWNRDYYRWELLNNLFNCGRPGSTILITTRKVAVARAAGSRETDNLDLGNLSDQDCCSIIRDAAFSASNVGPDAEMFFNEFGVDIALMCHGVPLIAKSLGFELHQTPVREWRELLEDYHHQYLGLGPDSIQEEEQEEGGVRQETTSFVMASDIHGRDYDNTILTEMLLNPSPDGQKQDVQYISIVGVAGIGKTALAQVVYNRPQVRCHFDLRSWIWVSKQFNLSDIAQSMLEGLTGESVHGKVGLESLFQRIGDIIGGKRFLFVLDDVWNRDYYRWELLNNLFNCGCPGSTILITTRKVAVARAAGSRETDILDLGNLSDQDCWSIIRDAAFSASNIEPDAEMFFNRFGADITLECHGVPLIAKSLGFELHQTPVRKWRELLENYDHQHLGLGPDSIHEEEQEEGGVRQQTTSFVHEATMHGRDDERSALIGMLRNEGGQARGIQVISIVGRPGIGKTALAQLVYNSPEVKEIFEFTAWVFVGEQFNLKRIVKAIMESLTSNLVDDVEIEALKFGFSQIVEQKRCLFVLDDIWSEDDNKWLDLKAFFTICHTGSRILITTRNEAAARVAGSLSTNIMLLKALSEAACWSIIKDQAFGSSIDEAYEEKFFEEVGREIVKKCDGVPLIAKSVGIILRGKDSTEQWREVLASDVWSSTDLKSSLMLSYSLMPAELKQCLLYCAIFPKNHSIDADKLIKLWMAHGFIASKEDEMEREGWRYVEQLLGRSIFQEFKQDDNGNFKCKLDSGMSDLIHYLAQNECHVMLLDYEKDHRGTNVPTKSRHCSLDVAPETCLPESIAYAEKLHTLMILSQYSTVDPTNLASLLSHMKKLRALVLSSCSIKELPLKVGEFPLLRYIDLSFNHDLKKLPEAICNLLNLQTLNLNGCNSLRKLPKGMGKLINLRHLEILWTTSLSYLPKGIASLTSLKTLSRFFGSSCPGSRACNLGDLKELNCIQGCITIDGLGVETEVADAEKASLKDKKNLLGLELWFSIVQPEENDYALLDSLEAPPLLQCLGIFYYRGTSFPNRMIGLERLTHLMLADCSKCNNLPPLGNLPSLESLEIKNMSNVKKLGSEFLETGSDNVDGIGEEGSSSTIAFPKLQKLRFQALDKWEQWAELDGGGRYANIMPSLSSLSITNCPKLSAIPDYIKRKENLIKVIKKCPLLDENAEDQE